MERGRERQRERERTGASGGREEEKFKSFCSCGQNNYVVSSHHIENFQRNVRLLL